MARLALELIALHRQHDSIKRVGQLLTIAGLQQGDEGITIFVQLHKPCWAFSRAIDCLRCLVQQFDKAGQGKAKVKIFGRYAKAIKRGKVKKVKVKLTSANGKTKAKILRVKR